MRRGHRFFLEKETCRGLRPQPVLTGGSALPSPPWGWHWNLASASLRPFLAGLGPGAWGRAPPRGDRTCGSLSLTAA